MTRYYTFSLSCKLLYPPTNSGSVFSYLFCHRPIIILTWQLVTLTQWKQHCLQLLPCCLPSKWQLVTYTARCYTPSLHIPSSLLLGTPGSETTSSSPAWSSLNISSCNKWFQIPHISIRLITIPRFLPQVATRIMKQMIEQFAACDLFGRDNYEYYARVTGRVLRVQDEWIFSFRYPPPPRGKTAQQNYACKWLM